MRSADEERGKSTTLPVGPNSQALAAQTLTTSRLLFFFARPFEKLRGQNLARHIFFDSAVSANLKVELANGCKFRCYSDFHQVMVFVWAAANCSTSRCNNSDKEWRDG